MLNHHQYPKKITVDGVISLMKKLKRREKGYVVNFLDLMVGHTGRDCELNPCLQMAQALF
jgi:hypothetical protein